MGTPFWGIKLQSFFFFFFCLICFSWFVCVITCLFKVGLCFLVYFEHVWLLELGFLFMLYFCVFRSFGQGLATHNLACACKLDCVRRPILACVCHCLETLIFFLFVCFIPAFTCLFCLIFFFSYVLVSISLYASASHVYLSFNMLRLGFLCLFLALMLCHSFTYPCINAIGVVLLKGK